MTTKLNISGISQEEFANRVLATLEGFSQSPIVKKKQSIINKAMVTLLHGGNNAGQNEHNLHQFFEEKTESVSQWIAQENYRHESDDDEMLETYEGATREEAEIEMFTSVISYLADWLDVALDVSDFEEHMGLFEENPVSAYLKANDFDCDSIEGEEVTEMLKEISSDASHIVLYAIFEYITNLMCVEGTHKVKEVKINVPKKEDQKVEPLTLYATKITFSSEDCDFDQESREIVEVNVELDRTEEAREERLSKLLYQHMPDEDMSVQYLLEKAIIGDLLESERKNPEHFAHASTSDILDWALSLVEASELISLVEEMSGDMVKISTYNDYI